MKKLIILTGSLLTPNAMADVNPLHWQIDTALKEQVGAVISGITQAGLDKIISGNGELKPHEIGQLKFIVIRGITTKEKVSFLFTSIGNKYSCGKLNDFEPKALLDVDGQKVKAVKICTELGVGDKLTWQYIPETDKGVNYIIDKMRSIETVEINGFIFKTTNFTKVYKAYEDFSKSLENAL